MNPVLGLAEAARNGRPAHVKKDPDFYIDEHHGVRTSYRTPRARFFRRRYCALKKAVIVLPLVVAVIGFGAFVFNDHRWRQATADDQVEIANLRSQVEALRGVVSGPREVCQLGSNGRQSCIRIIYPAGGA